jgi:hypothetical protein
VADGVERAVLRRPTPAIKDAGEGSVSFTKT